MEADALTALSRRIAAIVAERAVHVVRIEGRRRGPASGIAWSQDGLVVAASHAVERDEEIAVGLPSGETVGAEVVGRDPTTDLALLRARATGLVPAPWSEADAIGPGELLLAISRPGRTPRAALALLARAAGEFRGGGGGRIDRWLETTLDAQPGISGALVLDASGAPIGLANTALARAAILAVPAATLRRVVKSLLTHGEIRRGYLGLASLPVPLPAALRERTGEEVALLVTRVEPGSPAERAGLHLGDAILSFGGETLQDPGDLLAFLTEDRIGDAVALRVLRAGEVRDVSVTVGARGGRP